MMKVFIYVVAASKNPNAVECVVPYEVNKNLIFFGPCKKRFRRELYRMYLKNSDEADVSSENLYIIGVNGNNPEKIRKIVWVGKIQKLFTFERAYHILSSDNQFKKMILDEYSPLHLEPLYDEKKSFIGYKLRSKEHEKDDKWILDIIENKNDPNVEIIDRLLILKEPSKRKEVFNVDCCFLCENIFYAKGKGIDIDKSIIGILKSAQSNKSGINEYAIFGLRKDGSADGLTGSYLEIEGITAKKLIENVVKKVKSMSISSFSSEEPPLREPRVVGKCE